MWLVGNREEEMKITPELLKAMGFEQEKNKYGILIDIWRLKLHGYYYTLQNGPDRWQYFSPGSYTSHGVTDLEELLPMTYTDAYEAGKEDKLGELREFLGIDKKKGC